MFRLFLKATNTIFILATLLIGLTSYAEDTNKLYEAEVIFSANETSPQQDISDNNIDDTEQRQKQFVEQAFAKVVYKLTASDSFLKHPAYNELLESSHQLLQKYSYISITPSAEGDTRTNTQQPAKPEYKIFKALFNPLATQELLKKHNFSIWSGIRPDTLVWLSLEVNQQRRILSPSIDNQPFYQLQKQAEHRGLNLLFPLLDVEDKSRLSIADLWGDFPDAILAASQRYHTPSVLTVRIFQDASLFWIANWSLYVLDKNIHWKSSDESLNRLLRQGVDSLLPKLADIFKLKNADRVNNELNLLIHNVTSFKAYTKLEDYFKQVAVITDFHLKKMHEDRVLYNIKFVGNKKHLLQSLALGDLLQTFEKKIPVQTNTNMSGDNEYQAVILVDDIDEETTSTINNDTLDNAFPSTESKNTETEKVKREILDSEQVTENQPTKAATKEKVTDNPVEVKVDQFKPDIEFWLRD